jgi:hypothetical protein
VCGMRRGVWEATHVPCPGEPYSIGTNRADALTEPFCGPIGRPLAWLLSRQGSHSSQSADLVTGGGASSPADGPAACLHNGDKPWPETHSLRWASR